MDHQEPEISKSITYNFLYAQSAEKMVKQCGIYNIHDIEINYKIGKIQVIIETMLDYLNILSSKVDKLDNENSELKHKLFKMEHGLKIWEKRWN